MEHTFAILRPAAGLRVYLRLQFEAINQAPRRENEKGRLKLSDQVRSIGRRKKMLVVIQNVAGKPPAERQSRIKICGNF
jgi:hypothetical protein